MCRPSCDHTSLADRDHKSLDGRDRSHLHLGVAEEEDRMPDPPDLSAKHFLEHCGISDLRTPKWRLDTARHKWHPIRTNKVPKA